MFFGNGIYCAAMKHAKYSTAYSYVFSFNGTANIPKILSGGQEFPGKLKFCTEQIWERMVTITKN